MLGAKKVYFVEKDENAVENLRKNLEGFADLKKKAEIFFGDISEFTKKVDFVVENPPFGVQKRHADLVFLEKAFSMRV